jgi:penicillin-binding protein 1C
MQVVRLATGNKARTIFRKVKEIVFATRLEAAFPKDEILEKYLGLAPYGSNIIGIEAASWRYFGKAPSGLSWSQAAMLAVLPNNPAQLYPGKNNALLKVKRDALLKKLLQEEIISKETYQLSVSESIPTKQIYFPQTGTHLLQQEREKNPQGSTIKSTINSNLQNRCTQITEQYARNQQITNNVHNLSIVVTETATGKVLAYLGNAPGGYTPNWYVNAGVAPRSYGSLLKPFIYAAALDQGLILPEAWLEDIPHSYGGYCPKNFYNTYQGYEKADKALANSLNTCFVSLLHNYGIQRFHRLMKNYGVRLPQEAAHYGLSIALGGAESNLWQLTSMYRNMGWLTQSNKSGLIANEIGPIYYDKSTINQQADAVQIVSKQAAYLTLKAMANSKRPDLSAHWVNFAERRQIAWKTGTSFGLRDAWAIGVTPNYTVGVWVGNATGEGRPNLTGTLVAAPLMFQLFELLPAEKAWFKEPNLVPITVCATTGWKATTACDSTKTTFSLPLKINVNLDCKWHKTIVTNNLGTHRVNFNCYDAANATKRNALVIEGAPLWFYKEWERKNYASSSPLLYKEYPWLAGCLPSQSEVQIVYPANGATIVPVQKKAEETLGFYAKATNTNSNSELYWLLNGNYLTTSKGKGHVFVPTPQGSGIHTLTVISEYGTTHSITFYTQ